MKGKRNAVIIFVTINRLSIEELLDKTAEAFKGVACDFPKTN